MSGRYGNYHRDDRPPPPPYHRGGGGGGSRGGYDGGGGSRGGYNDNRRHGGGGYGGGGGGHQPYHNRRGPPPHHRPPPDRGEPRMMKALPITFRSYEEEQQWLADRRQRRMQRPTKFDIRGGANSGSGTDELMGNTSLNGQHQTRHARRLYVGNLPLGATESEIHDRFREAISATIDGSTAAAVAAYDDSDDPILTVYINHERRFSFIEFKTVEICSACMVLDGLEIRPGYPVKVKRPNDYNPALAPVGAEIPTLDVSRIGIISPTVLDGPNKIFIGGLHYYYTEPQVLELLRAFGKVKAFHLVKNDPESNTSKGYCFVEYVDPADTLGAVQGLNGMDIGDGKSLTARVAGGAGASSNVSSGTFTTEDQPPIDSTVVDGYDIESLVDAALGRRPMPTGPTYVDGTTGAPITRIKPGHVPPKAPLPSMPPPPPPLPVPMMMGNHNMPSLSMLPSVLSSIPTRILVLLNMVSMEDLETEDSHTDLMDEVRGECAKFGTILRLVIPRAPTDLMAPSSVRKIYLEYATVPEAMAAQEALSGRQFGDAVVGTEYYPERDFAQGRLV